MRKLCIYFLVTSSLSFSAFAEDTKQEREPQQVFNELKLIIQTSAVAQKKFENLNKLIKKLDALERERTEELLLSHEGENLYSTLPPLPQPEELTKQIRELECLLYEISPCVEP